MSNWKIFQGDRRTPHDGIESLESPPPWRQFGSDGEKSADKKPRGSTFIASSEAIDLVNAALYLRRPLLVTGKPGTGKTSLAYAVAHELKLGEVLYWSITTRTTLNDGLYDYDAIGRLQNVKLQEDAKLENQDSDSLSEIRKYIQLGPLGTALLPSKKPRVLLIDEIDKSDIDLPNDLLHVFEEGRFKIRELVRIAEKLPTVEVRTAYQDKTNPETSKDIKAEITEGRIQCNNFPFVILTSNGERDFPPAFLRRCLRLNIPEPNQEELAKIVKAHFDDIQITEEVNKLITEFFNKRQQGDLATDQLLNAIYLITRKSAPIAKEKDKLVEQLLKYLNSAEDR
ncbi:ATPase-like protein (plasmid) [Cylindrospermum sp. NIES-4074]|nr:ATPase-like protein [Cylindrospermum sp. NIES-4074]